MHFVFAPVTITLMLFSADIEFIYFLMHVFKEHLVDTWYENTADYSGTAVFLFCMCV